MRLAVVLALAMVVRSAVAWHNVGLNMQPDFDLYTQGGLGLYPSPLGRLAGALGPHPFAWLSILCSGLCVLAVGLLARRYGGSPAWSSALFFLSPASLYLSYAGIDAIALALLLLALSGIAGPLLGPVAALTHLSLLPFAILFLPWTWPGRFVAIVLGGAVSLSLLLTPYSGVLLGWMHRDALTALWQALAASLILLGVGALWVRFSPTVLLFFSVGVVECVLQHHLQARYLLPFAAVALARARPFRAPAFATTLRERLA